MASPRDRLLSVLARSIRDPRVLEAIAAVPRERFVPVEHAERAWHNEALPIEEGQTISQPLVVARMCELLALKGNETVLDVGTGSGYHAAVLAQLAGRVISIERHAALSARAAENLDGVATVELVVGDGAAGYPPAAPYDAINLAAASAAGIPAALTEQLADGGRLVLPVGGQRQQLVLVQRTGERLTRSGHESVRFVPLVTPNVAESSPEG